MRSSLKAKQTKSINWYNVELQCVLCALLGLCLGSLLPLPANAREWNPRMHGGWQPNSFSTLGVVTCTLFVCEIKPELQFFKQMALHACWALVRTQSFGWIAHKIPESASSRSRENIKKYSPYGADLKIQPWLLRVNSRASEIPVHRVRQLWYHAQSISYIPLRREDSDEHEIWKSGMGWECGWSVVWAGDSAVFHPKFGRGDKTSHCYANSRNSAGQDQLGSWSQALTHTQTLSSLGKNWPNI